MQNGKVEITHPLVTVIVATFNAEKSLPMTLESLGAQSFRDFEVILVDGGSVDHTVDLAREFPGISVDCHSEVDQGIADAWNKGLVRSRGRWVTFLNAGDLLHPHHLERAAKKIKEGFSEVLFCDVVLFDASGFLLRTIVGRKPKLEFIRRGSVGFSHPGSLVRRDVFNRIGVFSLDYKVAMDTEFLLRCYSEGVEFERMESRAYMVTGGVSDRHFYRGIKEYYVAARALNLVSPIESLLLPAAAYGARLVIRVMRRAFVPTLRTAKHFAIALLNALVDFLPFAGLRRIAFRMLKFRMEAGSSIGIGCNFYVLGRFGLGKRSVINRNCVLDNRGSILIGDDVSVARDVSIYTAGHDVHSPFFEMTMAPVSLEDKVVVFAGSTIMPGVTVGYGAVVYPGSIVTRDVEPMSIVAGAPAKCVGKRASYPRYSLRYEFPTAM